MKHHYVNQEVTDIGEHVECDACSTEFPSGDKRSGGFLFGSYAYCPVCESRALKRIKSYGEEHFIKARCPQGMPFRDWVLWLRDGNNNIIVTTVETKDE